MTLSLLFSSPPPFARRMQWGRIKINLCVWQLWEHRLIMITTSSGESHHMLLPSMAQRQNDWNSIHLWIPTFDSAFNWIFCTLKYMRFMHTHTHTHRALTLPMRNEQSKSFPIDFCLSLCWCGHQGVFHKAVFITCVLLWNENYNRGRNIFPNCVSLSEQVQLSLLGYIQWRVPWADLSLFTGKAASTS